MRKFEYRRFSSSDSDPSSKKAIELRRGRLCRIEELEGREMLSVSPWTLTSDLGNIPIETEYQLNDESLNGENALQPLGATVAASETAQINEKYGLNLSPGTVQKVANEFELRSALANANIDIIVVTNSDNFMVATGGEFTINRSVAIVNLGENPFSIEMNWRSRVFNIACNADVTLAGLTLTKGYTLGNGGAINNSGTLTMVDCILYDNQAWKTGILEGGLYNGHAGGIYNSGTLTIKNCTLKYNVSEYNGGGVYNTGTFTATDCTLIGNWADNTGGGILGYSGTISLTNCMIADNTAGDGRNTNSSSGGGIFSVSASITLTNCAIVGNKANGRTSGGLFSSIYGNGGGIYSGGPLTLTNCTVAGNTATGYGGGVYLTGTMNPNIFNNTIIAKNSFSDVYPSSLVNLSGGNNLIGDGTGQNAFVNGRDGNIVGNSVIGVDPLFVDVANGDYRLATGSLAINAGNNIFVHLAVTPVDLEGNPRIMGGIVDIGAYESDGSIIVVPQPPATPLDLTCTGKTETTVSLAWTAVPDATGYEIQYKTGNGKWSTADVIITGTTAVVSNLESGTEYEFQVRAVNDAGESKWSNSVFATTDENIPQPPATPLNLTCTGKTETTVSLAWTAVPDTTNYEIQYRRGNGKWSTADVSITGTTAVVSSLESGTEYEFQVCAVNDSGKSDWSNNVFATTDENIPPPPATPINLRSIDKTTESVTLEWTAVPDATGYKIQYKTGNGKWLTADVVIIGTTAVVSNLESGTEYEFQVRAVNDTGESDWSEPVFETTLSDSSLGLKVTDKTSSSVSLAWNAVSEATHTSTISTADLFGWQVATLITSANSGYVNPARNSNNQYTSVGTRWSDLNIDWNSVVWTDAAPGARITWTTPEVDNWFEKWIGSPEGDSQNRMPNGFFAFQYSLFATGNETAVNGLLNLALGGDDYIAAIYVNGKQVYESNGGIVVGEPTNVMPWTVPGNLVFDADLIEGRLDFMFIVHNSNLGGSSSTNAMGLFVDGTLSTDILMNPYEVRYRVVTDSGNGAWSSAHITYTDNTSVVHGLTPNTTYEFQVRSRGNGDPNAGWSDSVFATTEGTDEIPQATAVAITEVLVDTVPVSVTTQKSTACTLKAVKNGVNKPTLSSVSFSLTPKSKVISMGSDVVFEIAVYAGKVKKTSQPVSTVKISVDGTVLDDGGFVLVDKIDFAKPLTIDGLSASTKYTFFVKSVANGKTGHVLKSRDSKVCVSTLKYKTVSSLKVAELSSESISLQWKVNTKSKRYDAADTYEVYYIDSQGNEHVLTAVPGLEPQVNGGIAIGTFERGEVEYGTVLYVRAVKVIGSKLQSLTSAMGETETIVVKSQIVKVKVK